MGELLRFARREPGAIAAFVVMAAVFFAWMANTARPSIDTVAIVISQVLPLAMVSIGMTVVLLSKGIDLSVGTTLAISNVLIAKLAGDGWPVFVSIMVALGVAVVIGALNGALVAYAGLPSLVVTLAVSSILAGAALYILPQPGGSVPPWFSDISLQLVGPIPLSILLLVLVPLVLWYPVRRSALGPAMLAVGEDEVAAFTSGISVRRVRALTYVLAALFSSIGGVFMTMTSSSGDAKIGAPFTMRAIAACVLGGTLLLGGRGTVAGSVAGAVTLALMGNLMFSLGLNGYWQYVVVGLILVVVLAVPHLIREFRLRAAPAGRSAR